MDTIKKHVIRLAVTDLIEIWMWDTSFTFRTKFAPDKNSVMKYGIIFSGNSSNTKKLFTLKKKIIRITVGAQPRTPYRSLFKKLEILPIPCQYIFSLTGIFFFMAQQPIVVRGPLIVEALRSHSHTPHSVGLLLTRDIHAPGGIRSHNPSKRAAADPHLRPCGHWDRQCWPGCKHEQQRCTKKDIP
jgi:hypothetical protein